MHICSFMPRKMPLTEQQQRLFPILWQRYGIGQLPAHWLPEAMGSAVLGHGTIAKCTSLEIGFGNGQALLELAQQLPEQQFLGVEVYNLGVLQLLTRVSQLGLSNVQVYVGDVVDCLAALPAACLAAVYIFFPDPWPKNRHHKRRLLQPAFLSLLARTMQVGGQLFFATDWLAYAQHSLAVLEESPAFENVYGAGQWAPRYALRVCTKFEEKALQAGRSIYDLCFRRF
jgi:tRNA (guanine-N7-)-methyltransferase